MNDNKILKMLNEQMNFEFFSAHIYLGMASYCAKEGYKGFENWFKIQYQEEVAHAMKFFDFINSRGGCATVTNFGDISNEYISLIDVLESALNHERVVTKKIQTIAKEALSSADLTSFSFIQWFIDEQVEEEETLSDIITDVKRVGDANLYLVDKDLATRTFVPIEE